jgi:hypothetical protein
MLKILFTFFSILLLVVINLYSQESGEVIITEIMYNANSSETTEETQFIELANTTGSPVSLENWTIDDEDADGPNTLPNVTLPAYGIVVICGSSASDFTGAFGSGYLLISLDDLGQTMFNLGNSPSATDEIIYLRDNASNLVDSVNYDDANSWPGDPGGVSIYLALSKDQMNATSNNVGSNWANSQDGIDGAFTSSISGAWDAVEIGSPGNINGDQSLPVELKSFNAKAGDSFIELQWITASESENLGYLIMRNIDEEGDYKELDSYTNNSLLEGAGNSSMTRTYRYVDKTVTNGITYWYKLVDVDINGICTEHGPVHATPRADEVEINPIDGIIPLAFVLAQNYPNPFNPTTKISFDIPELKDGFMTARVIIYNMLGQKIKTLLNSSVEAGQFGLEWDGTNELNQLVPSGIYIYQFQSDLFYASKKMVLMR